MKTKKTLFLICILFSMELVYTMGKGKEMNSQKKSKSYGIYQQAESLTLLVGQSEGDFIGNDDKIIQAAVNYLSAKGGGVLNIAPGEYLFNNSLVPAENVLIRGSGEKTVFKKAAGVSSKLIIDTDLGEYAAEVENASGFTVGDGIMLTAVPQGDWRRNTHITTVTKVKGNTIYFYPNPEKFNFKVEKNAYIQKTYPLIYATHTDNVEIEDIVLEGNRENNEEINGNYSGALYAKFCNKWSLKNVVAQNYNGDGFSFQTCNDFQFSKCSALNNSNLGFHPGTGALRTVFKDCMAKGNDQGFFFCWNVQNSLMKNCLSQDNKRYGINFGHRDSNNVVDSCIIKENGEVGIIFRQEKGEFLAPRRNTVKNCTISDNKTGILIDGQTSEITISNCKFVNTSKTKGTVGLQIEAKTGVVNLQDNTFKNLEKEIEDLRKQ